MQEKIGLLEKCRLLNVGEGNIALAARVGAKPRITMHSDVTPNWPRGLRAR